MATEQQCFESAPLSEQLWIIKQSAGGGGGGAAGSITAAGVNGTLAQAVQGITGGIPVAVSLTSSPLPTGAATSANQATEIASLGSIDGKTPALVTGRVPVDGSGVTQPVSGTVNVGTSGLPTGAATSALQTTGNASLGTIATNSGTQATAALQTAGNASLGTIATNSGSQATAANQTSSQGTVTPGTAATKSQLAGAIYNSTPPSPTTGQGLALQADSKGNLFVIQPLPTTVNNTAYAASLILKASAGRLLELVGYNSKASAQFIQLFNSTTLPADTTAPVATFSVPAASNFSFALNDFGMSFTTGIVVCNSSTGPTKTIGSADCYFTASIF